MNKVNIIYWSGTGNTETMAEAIFSTCKDGAKLLSVDKATLNDIDEADVLFLGCPAMGDEVLEEGEMEPFMESIASLDNKKVILFGSYGWGDGQWMRDWEEKVIGLGATLVEESVMANYDPESSTLDLLKSLGEKYSK
ncbi:flavodoxin [[Clostridium] dakarense]|uniref:flavodoxin n=1 Tax=Faecalimicrobium dakarense TaxID=1301100 RepID=UPI0004B374E3|nr:flavodoxin [[Clostridium] dakarense]